MGAGKSTVGRLVAAAMSRRFVDLDETIEWRAGATIASIFARDGEAAFRRLEAQLLAEAAGERRVVVATGGGIMGSAENRDVMAQSGVTVWLAPEFETLAERLAGSPAAVRPLLEDRERARDLYASRLDDYARADHRLDVAADESAASVAARVVELVGGERCAT